MKKILNKLCSKCDNIKPISDFHRANANKDGYCSSCKDCIKEQHIINKERISEKKKEWREKNKEKISEFHKIYCSNRRKIDPMYKIITGLRSLISNSIRKMGYKKTSKTFKILGCDFNEFKTHIESQFKENMNWNNYGEWHLDHIIPISIAKTEKEIYELNNYTNLQPLWMLDNLIKSNKLIYEKI